LNQIAMDAVEITRVGPPRLEAVLPLLADYQRFYGVAAPDDARNRAFFARFCGGGAGILLAAADAQTTLGVACVYWSQDSISASDIAVLNDLYVVPQARGRGVGRALIAAVADAARGRGLQSLSWMTALDNHAAQRLYDGLGAERGTWHEYTLTL
jgi:ribosomal protein S18 acetylase RimI-like enzyme